MAVLQRGIGPAFNAAALLLRPPLRLLTTRSWQGAQHLPRDRGFVVVSNHVSWSDPVTLADFLLTHGVRPRFLAKQSLFEVPVVGAVLRATRQVPVLRGTSDVTTALSAAQEAVLAGECVVVYPDGTLTKDPQQWPMAGKTGAARIALATGCPVVPLAQWGPHQLLPRVGRPQLWPRPRLRVLVGEPVDLSAFAGRPLTSEVLREATEVVVGAVTALLEQLRGESAPPRWDPRTGARRPAGSDAGPLDAA
ncbi:1-acyl-sn-glycerol-3-phosphate acyltransferase [Quadrisphaera sp. DSM 44207]|uniref:lysophospholipid acyltransferase family protein n=1 Tax=Quadrisphaera sp. DSM 44207 TaxID=1881057 RepID=UPI00088E1761|nr:lysophospholipid acyltransferase family protein [Quadrisphaera sp. DSM 44207]SDQ75259.1 1-acyl-sn-glycerol-3-phosphate acyltransferases [Quadrisphaera sp. DSM 44207]